MTGSNNPAEDPIEIKRRQLHYRSWKRGTKEMDLLMGSFADANLSSMDTDELELFEHLLRESDPDLYNWFMGKAEPPANYENPMLQRFLSFAYKPEPY
jgi:antitoxin CptB